MSKTIKLAECFTIADLKQTLISFDDNCPIITKNAEETCIVTYYYINDEGAGNIIIGEEKSGGKF